MSGEQATIQIGGQIPYSISNLTDYGIILQCKPLVDADNRITVAVHAEAVINPDSGASMLIGGLKNVQKIPFLGDIPILGEFFKNKRELSSNRRARLKIARLKADKT